ncbi:OmpA family protein [Nocardiopsis synnemataformans]|uniref:OmpA family protein n=1 Tax=Nocardiopsis synnemataformans TaxID=61305 RepID=UPI003EC0F305
MHQEKPSPQERETISLLPLGAALTSLALLTSGCVIDSETPTQNDQGKENPNNPSPSAAKEEDEGQAIASSASSSSDIGSNLQVDIYALERVGDSLLRLRLGITNKSNQEYYLYAGLADSENPYTASRVTLIDAENQTRHLSHNQSDGSCFCLPFEGSIEGGETVETWVIYPEPPPEVERMTVVTPLTPPFLDIPISTSSETLESQGISEPEIRDLTMISDNTEDQTGRTESNDEVSIILSSDVLFETNSADLSPDAEEIIQQVASEIDDASSSTVSIDGHADNTGNESINLPLSQKRAETVESVLADLVTRSGISFEVEGHGASEPIANNDTEEGRERNRRVSVTFEK